MRNKYIIDVNSIVSGDEQDWVPDYASSIEQNARDIEKIVNDIEAKLSVLETKKCHCNTSDSKVSEWQWLSLKMSNVVVPWFSGMFADIVERTTVNLISGYIANVIVQSSVPWFGTFIPEMRMYNGVLSSPVSKSLMSSPSKYLSNPLSPLSLTKSIFSYDLNSPTSPNNKLVGNPKSELLGLKGNNANSNGNGYGDQISSVSKKDISNIHEHGQLHDDSNNDLSELLDFKGNNANSDGSSYGDQISSVSDPNDDEELSNAVRQLILSGEDNVVSRNVQQMIGEHNTKHSSFAMLLRNIYSTKEHIKGTNELEKLNEHYGVIDKYIKNYHIENTRPVSLDDQQDLDGEYTSDGEYTLDGEQDSDDEYTSGSEQIERYEESTGIVKKVLSNNKFSLYNVISMFNSIKTKWFSESKDKILDEILTAFMDKYMAGDEDFFNMVNQYIENETYSSEDFLCELNGV